MYTTKFSWSCQFLPISAIFCQLLQILLLLHNKMKVCESTSVWKSELREGFLVVIMLIYWVCTTGGGGRSWSKIMERFSSGCQFREVCFNWLVIWSLTMKTRHMTLQMTYHMTKKWHHHYYCHGHNGEPTYCKYNWNINVPNLQLLNIWRDELNSEC